MDQAHNLLGSYLKERRARLDPVRLGLPMARRRTPGLRREEVAQRANVSPTWYTWLEQGRGGAPSAEVLERLAGALSLSDAEREHMFLLAQGRPPRVRRPSHAPVSSQLQAVLDAFEHAPAVLKTPEWTIVAWNRAASVVLAQYDQLEGSDRNLLRMLFLSPRPDHLPDWDSVARLIVGSVQRDVLRAGMQAETAELIDELCQNSPEFRKLWADQDVQAHGEGSKRIVHPRVGMLTLDFSTFAVDGRPDLALLVFNPATAEDRARIDSLLAEPAIQAV